MPLVLEDLFYDHRKSHLDIEDISFCHYSFKKRSDNTYFDQFGCVINSNPFYLRVFPCRNGLQYGHSISSDSTYVNFTIAKRDEECPKIAWGIAAWFIVNLQTEIDDSDYVIKTNGFQNVILASNNSSDFCIIGNIERVFDKYYNIFWVEYKNSTKGLANTNISMRKKEINFTNSHLRNEINLWKKSSQHLQRYLNGTINTSLSVKLWFYTEKFSKNYLSYVKKKRRQRKIWYISFLWIKSKFGVLLNVLNKVCNMFKALL